MSGIVVLVGQLGIVLGGFMGMTQLLNWYHKDKKEKVVEKNDRTFNRQL